MGRQKGEKGLILSSEFIRFLSLILSNEEFYIKEYYERCVNFFEQALEQKLEKDDKKKIKYYFSSFKNKHASRIKFWSETKTPYRRKEGNGRIK